jgi:predicted metalloprotease with PDZ domain
MRLIGEAVHEGGGAFFEGVDDARSYEDRAEGRVTTGDSLPRENDVGLETPVLAGEGFAGAAHARHDFIGDEEDAVAAADFGDASGVAVDGRRSTERGADDGFEDEGGDGGSIVGTEKDVEVIGAGKIAFGIGFAERAVITEARSDVSPFRDHGRVGGAAADVAADSHGAKGAAMVALLAGDDAVTGWLPGFEKILAREFDSGFGGFGAAGSEIDAAAILKIARGDGEDAGGKFFGGFGVELRSVGEGDATRLLGHGAADFGNTVADADDGGLAGGIEVAAAIGGDNPAAFAADGDGVVFAKIAGKKRGGADGGAHSKIVAEAANRRVVASRGRESQVGRERRGGGILFRGFGGWILITKLYARIALVLMVVVVSGLRGAVAQTADDPARIDVDLRDAVKYVFHAQLSLPAKPGPMTLVYPKWIPGDHSPVGPIFDLTGLKVSASGKEVAWKRDDVDMFAFHIDVPGGANRLDIKLDYLSPAQATGSRENPAATAQLAVLNWYLVMLYPQGAKSDDITYVASLRLPANWKYGTALPVLKEAAGEIEFAPASLTKLMDSPVIAGAFFKDIDLSPGQKPQHTLHIAADGPAALEPSAAEVQHLRQLIAEDFALFGARHYRRYDFLLALSDRMSPDGVEHHESSDNRTPESLFLDPDVRETQMDLLAHEYTHSWNGKYRRPAGLATPDYQAPMKGELLWVYEGLTQYYGQILSARAGFWTPERFREQLAATAAYLNNRPGRTWRDLQDTAIAAQLLYSASAAGASWRRGVDYYDESTLIWLEADTIIRRESKGKTSLDDFCRKFYGGENTGPKLVTYSFEDVVAGMNEVAAYDWRNFFEERLKSHGPGAPLKGIENSGWKLVFDETMNEHQRAEEAAEFIVDAQYSLGFQVQGPGGPDGGKILDVIPGSLAERAGLAPGMQLVAVDGRKWSPDLLRDAIRRAKDGKEPIELLAQNGDYFRTYGIDYHGGERYPHLELISGKTDVLTEIVKMKAAPVAAPAK